MSRHLHLGLILPVDSQNCRDTEVYKLCETTLVLLKLLLCDFDIYIYWYLFFAIVFFCATVKTTLPWAINYYLVLLVFFRRC